ncbi:EamA domain-containing membrane protein RarD [Seinonella peptonophila]|uniref:EamA domain-containing membrane protein RarD n=1 Tax=Seinonella peptonophila TaxID=112248 RepID=A0A1M4SY53_9BACL|nr:DMT family transporter [Seinonella peptonophila]SHE37105.1 EamA domain-containing membrane protein RarD [Seinonella peptonophila]
MRSHFKGILYILLSATGFGLTPVFGKMAFQANVSIETLLFLRFLVAFICLSIYLLIKERNLYPSRDHFWILVLLGFLYYAQTTLYFTSLKHIIATLAVMLLYLYPVFVMVLSLIFEKRSATKGMISALILSLVGIGTLLGIPTGKIDIYGVILAISSALAYAIYVMVGKRLIIQLTPVVTSTWIIFFTMLAFLLSGTFTQHLQFQFSTKGWIAVTALALFSTVVSFWSFFAGMKFIGSTRASIVSTFEPIVTTVCAVMLLDESINLAKIFGVSLVITSVILLILLERDKQVKRRTVS